MVLDGPRGIIFTTHRPGRHFSTYRLTLEAADITDSSPYWVRELEWNGLRIVPKKNGEI